jgi:hypothetical protein
MSMIEKAARALCIAQGYSPTPDELGRAEEEVRAVLLAIREPSEAMVWEAVGVLGADGSAREAWTAMIDAALEDGHS